MAICNLAVFKITDGEFSVNLLDKEGFHVLEWTPSTPEFKGGGTWGDSPFVDGAYPVFGVYANVEESMTVTINAPSPDSLAAKLQTLRRLLRQASVFWFGNGSPVYLIARMHNETNTRYAVLTAGSLPSDGVIFAQPGLQQDGRSVMAGLQLSMTRLHWTANLPGVGTTVEMLQTMTYNGHVFGTVDDNEDESELTSVIVANKQNIANLTNVHNGTAGSNLLGGVLPVTLFDSGADLYIGISASVTNSGPFNNVIFNLGVVGTGAPTLVWEYMSAAGPTWSALTMFEDNTEDFTITGIQSVHFEQPTFHTGTSPGGSLPAGFWVRVRISAGSFTAEPEQYDRDIYTQTLPYFDIEVDQVDGDVPALASIRITNPVQTGLNHYIHRVVGGIKTIDDDVDELFAPIINLADEQNPTGITVSASGGFTTLQAAATGRGIQTSNGAGTELTGASFTIDSSLLPAYEGNYRVLLRLGMASGVSSVSAYIHFLHVTSGGAGLMEFYTRKEPLLAESIIQWVDLGIVSIPLSGHGKFYGQRTVGDLTGEVYIVNDHASTTVTMNHYDVAFIPIDELSFDASAPLNFLTSAFSGNDTLLVDNILSDIPHAILYEGTGSTLVEKLHWQFPVNGKVRLNTQVKQRLCFVTEHTLNAAFAAFHARPTQAMVVSVEKQQQYFSLRGEF